MSDYKETLNLPGTGFPMKANLPQREPDLLDLWDQSNLYTKIRKQQKTNCNDNKWQTYCSSGCFKQNQNTTTTNN